MTNNYRCPSCNTIPNIIKYSIWIDNERTANCYCGRCGREWNYIEKDNKK